MIKKIFLNGTETTRATEFRLVGCNGADFVPPRPSGSFSAEVKKSELSATERAMWDLFNFQQKTGKPRIVRVKNPVEILFGGGINMSEVSKPPKSHLLPTQLFPTCRNVGEMADYIEWQKRMAVEKVGLSCSGFFLIAIRKDSVVFRQKFELKLTAIEEAKDFWVNKGFLAVEVFHIESGERGNNIVVDYHGLRNY